jgi:hypothetical protein
MLSKNLANDESKEDTNTVGIKNWSDNIELLMKQWGEKAAGLRFMHNDSGKRWKKFSNRLSIASILITSLASTMSLVATSIDDDKIKDIMLFSVGGIGLLSTLIQSFKKFYNAEEKTADHSSSSKQFGTFYRYMILQLSMSRDQRDPPDILTNWALKEYERLLQEAPPVEDKSVALFKSRFNNSLQSIPDVAEDKFIINVHKNQHVYVNTSIDLSGGLLADASGGLITDASGLITDASGLITDDISQNIVHM